MHCSLFNECLLDLVWPTCKDGKEPTYQCVSKVSYCYKITLYNPISKDN